MGGINNRSIKSCLIISLIFICAACHDDAASRKRGLASAGPSDSTGLVETTSEFQPVCAMLVLPRYPKPGESFRIMSTGGGNIRKAKILAKGPAGTAEVLKTKIGEGSPQWRIDDFSGAPAGKYKAELTGRNKVIASLEFEISPGKETIQEGKVWKSLRGWDISTEAIYSAWISALFSGCDEQASWSALHEVTQIPDQNFLYNYLSLDEDDPKGKTRVIMQPDCADNPFYLRAYFAWKLGLPFGYHLCDRGSLVRNPKTGQWITNETFSSKTNPVLAFNSFLRRVADGVHSGTARTALDDENSDYYPVPLEQGALRPGTVYADPYGHTLILVGHQQQTGDHPGLLLAADAQPDGTVGIKRFWKGNFLFNTKGVIGEPGFKAFRPITLHNGEQRLMQNEELKATDGLIPFSLKQRKMETDVFYHTMERIINPQPLDPEAALLSLIQALHEQLLVRVTSVANGEAYFKSHPGAVIAMPSSAAGVFQTGGLWEDFSTPNRDLRLLIAMDAVLGFPDYVASEPEDYKISGSLSPEQMKKKLQSILDKRVSELTVSYARTDGSQQILTVGEILRRIDAFEMAYNPNDGIEIRWGAPENSAELSTCHRRVPEGQLKKMGSVRVWFSKRLHPPT